MLSLQEQYTKVNTWFYPMKMSNCFWTPCIYCLFQHIQKKAVEWGVDMEVVAGEFVTLGWGGGRGPFS